jgi:hypothetical protein
MMTSRHRDHKSISPVLQRDRARYPRGRGLFHSIFLVRPADRVAAAAVPLRLLKVEMDDMPLPELQYNVRLLVDEAEAEVVMLDGRLR